MVYCTNCGIVVYVTFPNNKELTEDDVKFCPKCGKEIVRTKIKLGGIILAVLLFFAIILAGLFLDFFRKRDSEPAEAEAVSVNYTTLADQWELEEDDEFEWDEI